MRHWILRRQLVIACAGAGKSERIINEAISNYRQKKRSLILTYTDCNQKQIIKRISKALGAVPGEIAVKGWFTFLLEDMIRPYQSHILENRVAGLNFNETDPHKRSGYTIKGRSEKHSSGKYNHMHFVTDPGHKAHSTYLSKLACRIAEESKVTRKQGRRTIKFGSAAERLEEIYDTVFIDEVQDLVGWDFEVLKSLSASESLDITCVGDFRQTIYQTANAQKHPKTNSDKRARFKELGFTEVSMNFSRRSVLEICEFSDLIHEGSGYPPTGSKVALPSISEENAKHIGVFAVNPKHFRAYQEYFNPTILRHSINSGVQYCVGREAFNFGQAKGMTFARTLILPTEPQMMFLRGNRAPLESGTTDKAVNAFYVASTRAQYSVAFLIDGLVSVKGVTMWTP
ncbi:UvrD-helicase domain-containing protein [Sulfitobacter sp. HI0023]|uniref:UvrD-helicase domain-containing protein n=1 Tax=Sulfitobacter sp. HI0023 TaxID=1822225 RepID=UPI0009EEE4E3|nr:UvrD-helicase domain-containing protein [Sulfitobacter sp. HI0023]